VTPHGKAYHRSSMAATSHVRTYSSVPGQILCQKLHG
jgi:hypothetical protein